MKSKYKFNPSKLKNLRVLNKLSYQDFANKLKPYNSKASKMICFSWESKKRTPSSEYLLSICDIFEKSPYYFFDIDKNIKES